MSKDIFEKALEYCENRGEETIVIGGGEPTMHPNFDEFLFKALCKFDYVWMATNGKNTQKTLDLISLAKKYDGFQLAVSKDRFHEPIDNKIFETINSINNDNYYKNKIEIRTVRKIINEGRAKELDDFYYEKEDCCCCPDIIINPFGEVKWCGCADSTTVDNVKNPVDHCMNLYGECYKQSEEYKEFLEK